MRSVERADIAILVEGRRREQRKKKNFIILFAGVVIVQGRATNLDGVESKRTVARLLSSWLRSVVSDC